MLIQAESKRAFLRSAPAVGLMFFLVLGCGVLQAALLINVPVSVVQPNGERLDLFASGDEFYNWLHDKAGYTIIQEADSGYFVYAKEQDGRLVSSGLVVSRDPDLNQMSVASLGLPKHLKDSAASRQVPGEQYPQGSPATAGLIVQAPKTGTINNIVVFIRFSGEPEYTDAITLYDDMFNKTTSGYNSMRNYFQEASYGALTISTTFYPTPSITVVSYQDGFTRPYYQPYHAVTNPIGYQTSTQRRDREHTLLKNAVNAVSSQIPAGLNVDGDSDGNVDNVCFVVYGGPGAWADLLWPHMWSLYSQTAYINGKRVWTYNFQLQTSLMSSGVGVLCHEMFHSLGAPDLYHYSYDGLHPAYTWGLMEYNSNPPRHMLSYMKYRYGNWISSIPEITSPGTYSLNPLSSSSNNCYKIQSPYDPFEYFVLEYRRRTTAFENSLPGEGLLVTRINNRLNGIGNADGPPDEVYIYRPNGTLTADGSPSSANFNSSVGRTSINDGTNPRSFLSGGSYGGLSISSIGAVGSTISFNVGFPAVGTSMLKVRATVSSTAITISPNDIYGNGGSTTEFSRVYTDGQVVNVTAPATSGSLNFVKWYLDGVEYSSSASTSVTMAADHTLMAMYGVDLGEAVDNTNLTWQVEGNGWYGQTAAYYSGNDAAQSADIGDAQETVLKTMVLGPGTFTFYWRVSSETGYDYLRFYIDENLQHSISGEAGWAQRTYAIPSGVHILRWKYSKDYSVSSGSDAGWVDLVTYTSGRPWQILSGVNPESVLGANTDGLLTDAELVGDFGALGLWHWNPGTWTCLSGVNPENVIAADTDGDSQKEIVADFGSLGVWRYDSGTWTCLSGVNCDQLIPAYTDAGPTEEMAGDFGGLGLWLWKDGAWTQLSTGDPESVIAASTNGVPGQELIVDFGASGLHLWQSTGWTALSGNDAQVLVAGDTDGDGSQELYADFGPLGLFEWDSSAWTQIHASDIEDMIAVDVDAGTTPDDELAVDFGGAGLYLLDGGVWTMLSASSPTRMSSADVDGDSKGEIIANFASLGLHIWTQGFWTRLTGSGCESIVAADTSGDGSDEIAADFGSLGLWIW